MDNVERLNTLCPVCDGPIHFEAYRLGEWVNCPHCQETIALGSVEPLPATRTRPVETAAMAWSGRKTFELLACATAMFFLLACGAFWHRKVAAVQPAPKPREPEMAVRADPTPPPQQPAALPASPPTPVLPLPKQDDALAEQIRQRQEQLNQQQLIYELRRANDLAEANARWQQWNEIESQSLLDSQPAEIIQPVEMFQPVQTYQLIQAIQPPIRIYGGGIRIGGQILRNYRPSAGLRVQPNVALPGNGAYTAPFGN